MERAAVERALAALEEQGARRFDVLGCDCVRTLLARSEELGGEVEPLLLERAAAHVERLRVRFGAAQQQTRRVLEVGERRQGALPVLREAAARGELLRARRGVRRLLAQPLRPVALAHGRGRDDARRRASQYEESLADLVAALALARAVDVVPEHAGPYNALRIASELLTRMRAVSPIYLTAQLNRLEELASLLTLPELPAAPAQTLPRKRRGALKKGS